MPSGPVACWVFSEWISSSTSSVVKEICSHGSVPSSLVPRLSRARLGTEEEPANTSDHLPVTCKIRTQLPLSPSPHQKKKPKPPSRPKWRKLTTHELKRAYTTPLKQNLSQPPPPAMDDYISNPHLIDEMLAHITSSMKSIASANVPMQRFHPHHLRIGLSLHKGQLTGLTRYGNRLGSQGTRTTQFALPTRIPNKMTQKIPQTPEGWTSTSQSWTSTSQTSESFSGKSVTIIDSPPCPPNQSHAMVLLTKATPY